MTLDTLSGKVALVTGASRGIGRAIALALGEAGVDVAVNYLARESAAQETCERLRALGRRALAIQADVSRAAEVARLHSTVEEQLGPVEILVNNAGITRPQPLPEITEADWDELLDTNLKSVFLVTQQVLPGMRAGAGGASSISRRWPRKRAEWWARTMPLPKPASWASPILTPPLLSKEGITVNAIAPALIYTEMVASIPRPARTSFPWAASAPSRKWPTWPSCWRATVTSPGRRST